MTALDEAIITQMVSAASEMLAKHGDGENHTVGAAIYAAASRRRLSRSPTGTGALLRPAAAGVCVDGAAVTDTGSAGLL